MTIKDLKRGMNCTILSVHKDKSFEHPVRIQEVKRDTVLTDAIKVDGKVVSLSGVSNFLIVQVANGTPEVFSYVVPVICKEKEQTFYSIRLLHAVSKQYNRRKNTRCPIGAEVNVRADNNRRTYPCVLKDISATGFALVFTGKNIPPDYKNIKTFHCLYSEYDPRAAYRTTLDLTGTVKRRLKIDEQQVLFGCHFAESRIVENYIANKTRTTQPRTRSLR